MEYVLNELSLCGQYSDGDEFSEKGVKPLLGAIRTLSSFGVNDILKKSSFFDSAVAPELRLFELTRGRMSPSVKAVCSQLSRMQGAPYWDEQPVQDTGKEYFAQKMLSEDGIKEISVSGTGMAEAHARKGCIISFCGGGYDNNSESVRRDDETEFTKLANLHDKEETVDFLFSSGYIDFQSYVRGRFCGKLVYDELSDNHGLNLVNGTNFRQFFASFKDFEEYSWQQILTSDGFDYKDFNRNKNTRDYFTAEQWAKGVKKFRVSQEIRCFGYREGECFHLLRIDLDHILSDKG